MRSKMLARTAMTALAALFAIVLLAASPASSAASPPGAPKDLEHVTSGSPDGTGGPSVQLYSPAYSLYATQAPQYALHPAGVYYWRLFGNTYFLANNYAQIGKSLLIMQTDGNFVLYDENGGARWATYTFGSGNYAAFQPDGNLVVYNSGGGALWASNTCCNSGFRFAVQADGNLVIYTSGLGVAWTTGTNH